MPEGVCQHWEKYKTGEVMDNLSQCTILLVDDVETNIDVLFHALQDDYQIGVVLDGQTALEYVRSYPPDLILLDVMMPGLNGYDVCRKLKAEERTRNIPIIFITAKGEMEDEVRWLEVGAIDYITKPFNLPIVRAKVRKHLELKKYCDTLKGLSPIDELTGASKRRFFDVIFRLEWGRAMRGERPLSLIMTDIDFFDALCEKYGQKASEDCLKKVAQELSASIRRSADFLARYDDRRFAVILPETDSKGTAFVAERMRANVEALGHTSASERVTISLGMTTIIPSKGYASKMLEEEVLRMLDAAKAENGNCVKSSELKGNEEE